jgi:hypothetical protein
MSHFPERQLCITEHPKLHKGFSVMNPDEHRRIARLGGSAAQKGGKAHRLRAGSQEAVACGRKGGLAKCKGYEHTVQSR